MHELEDLGEAVTNAIEWSEIPSLLVKAAPRRPCRDNSSCALALEGTETEIHAITSASLGAWLALLWQSVGNTLFGFPVWSWLLAKHSAASITRTALPVPIFGILTSALIGGEVL